MKKTIRYILLATSLLLAGCNKTTETSSEVLVSSEPEISFEAPSSSSYPESIKNSKWGEEAAKACYDTIGAVVPFMEAQGFSYNVTKDDYGDPAIWFYLYFDTQEVAEEKITDYAYAAWEQDGYECVVKPTRFFDQETFSYWTQNVLYADLPLNNENAIEIQALASEKSYNGKIMGCLGLFCFNYIPNLTPNEFPSYAVSTVAGRFNEVPVIKGEGLTFDFAFFLVEGVKCLEIVVTSTSTNYEIEEEYFNSCLHNQFAIVQYDDLTQDFTDLTFYKTGNYPEFDDTKCYYAYAYTQDYCVYFDYDLYNQAFYIDILPLSK